MGLLEADGPERHTAVAAAAGVAKTVGHATGDSGRRRSDAAQGQQARMVAVQGVLVTDGAEGGEWRWWASRDKSSQGGGFVSSEDGSEEEYYR